MQVDQRRVRKQNANEYKAGAILYWMNRDMRLTDNWALLYAQELAHDHDVELAICYNLDSQFLGGTLRQLEFKIGALRQLHTDAQKKNISFHTLVGNDMAVVTDFVHTYKIGAVVTDFAPLRIQQKWLKQLNKAINIPLYVVDTHNIVPVWEVSDKKEFAAYTIRPKINKKLKEFLTDFPALNKQKDRAIQFQDVNFDTILKTAKTDRTVLPVSWCKPGEKAAHATLKKFLDTSAEHYGDKRNDPVADVQSQLSPYLHYGMISPQRVAYEAQRTHILQESKEAFLEELIVRRELADNFCYFEPDYDNPKGFHEFFINEHKRIAGQKHEYVYTLKQFENAETHDDLWNACQLQMTRSGKMHGYLRMYWAKMIFAWSKNVEEAMKIAIYLNDKYELDGRDPNGYAGIAWCIGGVHDRPWYPNPVFGKLRYMSRNGMVKKFDVKAYISKWMGNSLF
jgi:deoxyribodipyrimidine photo-lyase